MDKVFELTSVLDKLEIFYVLGSKPQLGTKHYLH